MKKWNKIILIALLVVASIGVLMPMAPVSAGTWDPTLGWNFEDHTTAHANLKRMKADALRAEMNAVNAVHSWLRCATTYCIPIRKL